MYDSPSNYPSEMVTIEGKIIRTKHLFKILKDAVELCTQNSVREEWRESRLKAYSGTKGIIVEGSSRIIKYGNNIMAYKYHIENNTDDSALSNLMKQDHIDNPGKYKPWTGGAFWHSDLSLDIF